VQSIILTEVSNWSLLIVITSSMFLKRTDMSRKGKAVSQDYQPTARHIYGQMYFVHMYGLHVHHAFVDVDSSGSSCHCVCVSTPLLGLQWKTQVVCVCAQAYIRTKSTTTTPAEVKKFTIHISYWYPCQNIAPKERLYLLHNHTDLWCRIAL